MSQIKDIDPEINDNGAAGTATPIISSLTSLSLWISPYMFIPTCSCDFAKLEGQKKGRKNNFMGLPSNRLKLVPSFQIRTPALEKS